MNKYVDILDKIKVVLEGMTFSQEEVTEALDVLEERSPAALEKLAHVFISPVLVGRWRRFFGEIRSSNIASVRRRGSLWEFILVGEKDGTAWVGGFKTMKMAKQAAIEAVQRWRLVLLSVIYNKLLSGDLEGEAQADIALSRLSLRGRVSVLRRWGKTLREQGVEV